MNGLKSRMARLEAKSGIGEEAGPITWLIKVIDPSANSEPETQHARVMFLDGRGTVDLKRSDREDEAAFLQRVNSVEALS